MKAADSKDAVEVQEALAGIRKEMDLEQFDKLKEQADTMSLEQVIDLALA